MSEIIEWLNNFDTEYNVKSKILHIRKPMRVVEFVYLKKVLEPYRDRISDIRIDTI